MTGIVLMITGGILIAAGITAAILIWRALGRRMRELESGLQQTRRPREDTKQVKGGTDT